MLYRCKIFYYLYLCLKIKEKLKERRKKNRESRSSFFQKIFSKVSEAKIYLTSFFFYHHHHHSSKIKINISFGSSSLISSSYIVTGRKFSIKLTGMNLLRLCGRVGFSQRWGRGFKSWNSLKKFESFWIFLGHTISSVHPV